MAEDDDLAFALFLQEQFNNENDDESGSSSQQVAMSKTDKKGPSSIVDEAWELIDPAPDIRQLFLQFNDEYFFGQLGGVEVRWSPRMTLCAGLCCYEGRGGLCSIRLSEPLLKLRPRRDLVQTLLHEMIHALLFVTQNNKDHDGHGPEFCKHMYRINKETGSNITVDVYRQHWWKCNGPCQKRRPFYGVVKRSMNRAPSPRDTWWSDHQTKCGGTFTKIKEPENYGKKKKTKDGAKAKEKMSDKSQELGSKGTPSLPSLFERIKGKNSKEKNADLEKLPGIPKIPKTENIPSTSASGASSSKTSKIIGISELESESDDDSDVESKAKKRKVEESETSILTVLPFSGKGHVLGSRNNKNPDENKRPTSSGRIEEGNQNSISKPGFVISHDTGKPNNRVPKRKEVSKDSRNTSVLTIEDAFKMVRGTSKAPENSTPLGARNKPIILSDSPSTSQSLSDVKCPVCQVLVAANQINNHLDSCLQAT